MSHISKLIRKPVGIACMAAVLVGAVSLGAVAKYGVEEGSANSATKTEPSSDPRFLDDLNRSPTSLESPRPPDPLACPAGQVTELRVYRELNDYLPYDQRNTEVALYGYHPVSGIYEEPEHDCMTFDEVTNVVKLAIPKLHRDIVAHNVDVEAKSEPLRELEAIQDGHDRMVEAVKASCEYAPVVEYSPPVPPDSTYYREYPDPRYSSSNTGSRDETGSKRELYRSTVLVDASPATVERWIDTITDEATPSEVQTMPIFGKKGEAELPSYSAIEEIYGEAWKEAFPVGEMPDPAFPRDLSIVAAPVCGVS